jgi:hypothetical protein
MIRMVEHGDDKRLSEIAEILAAGYLRLQAIIREPDNAHHHPPNKSDDSGLYSLDNTRHRRDEWCAAGAASPSPERR